MLGIKVKNEAFMAAVDRFAECCWYVDFKRELIRERIVAYIKEAHF